MAILVEYENKKTRDKRSDVYLKFTGLQVYKPNGNYSLISEYAGYVSKEANSSGAESIYREQPLELGKQDTLPEEIKSAIDTLIAYSYTKGKELRYTEGKDV